MKRFYMQITTSYNLFKIAFFQALLAWAISLIVLSSIAVAAPKPTKLKAENDSNASKLEMINPSRSPLKSFEALEGRNEFTFDKSSPGVCIISCVAKMTPDVSKDWTDANVTWSISPQVEGSTLEWGKKDSSGNIIYGPGNNTGLEVYIRFTGLPEKNSAFGLKTVTVTAGKQSKSNPVEIFFDKTALNHPVDPTVDELGTPNWYYYWKQTAAASGTFGLPNNPSTTHIYGGTGGTGRCMFTNGRWLAHIGPIAHDTTAGGTWGDAKGIDLFANICRHEEQHRQDMIVQWGANGNVVTGQDTDGDYLRHDSTQPTLSGREVTITPSVPETIDVNNTPATKYDPGMTETFKDQWKYALGVESHHILNSRR